MKNYPKTKPSEMSIMVVDDERPNTLLLKDILEQEGYRVTDFVEPAAALEYARKVPPHLFLLDIMMPEIDGFDLCKLLKDRPETADVPVVFLTSLSDIETKILAFEVGGVDFITKPFQHEEVVIRVKTQVDLYFTRLELKRYAEDLEEMVETRTRQLIHSDRLVTLGTMSAKIIHEINNPLSATLGHLQLLVGNWAKISAELTKSADPEVAKKLEFVRTGLDDALQGAERIRDTVRQMRKYARRDDEATRKEVALERIVLDALRIMHPRLKNLFVTEVDIPPEIVLTCDAQRIGQVFINLISNAADAAGSGTISVSARMQDGEIRILFADDGPGIPPHVRDRIFEPFFTTKNPDSGTGLGMVIVEQIVGEHGGRISVVTDRPKGAAFEIVLNPSGRTE